MVGHQSRAGKANHIRKEKGRVRIFTVADGLADNSLIKMLLSIVMVPSILDAAGEL